MDNDKLEKANELNRLMSKIDKFFSVIEKEKEKGFSKTNIKLTTTETYNGSRSDVDYSISIPEKYISTFIELISIMQSEAKEEFENL